VFDKNSGWLTAIGPAGRPLDRGKEAKSRQDARFFRLPGLIAPIRGAGSAKPMGIARQRPEMGILLREFRRPSRC
jgi:hypothetical protein